MNKTKIVWNGCDGDIKSAESFWTSKEEFKPFDVIEINIDNLPKDEDGEAILDGVFLCESGKAYKSL
jgi:hypothetical protein